MLAFLSLGGALEDTSAKKAGSAIADGPRRNRMPYRTFVDSLGTDWQVWDIVPRLSERRHPGALDRRVAIQPIRFADRRAESRRLTETRRAILRGSYAQGWLCFDSDKEKRRLTPIPEDWTTCSDDTLELYVREAEAVKGAHRGMTTYPTDDYLAEAG